MKIRSFHGERVEMRTTVSRIARGREIGGGGGGERERGRTDNIRNVAQQRFVRRSLCFGYFCTLCDMKVRLRSSFAIVCSRLMPQLLDTLVILCERIFPYYEMLCDVISNL